VAKSASASAPTARSRKQRRGYAIGFDGKMLETAFTRLDDGPILEHMTFPVSYDEAKLQSGA
jgi:hypothetical protein